MKNLADLRDLIMAMPMAQTLQLRLTRVELGEIDLEIPVLSAWCFKPGQLQATVVFAAADFAAVAAAGTLLPEGFVNATTDATIKLVAPARGSHLLAKGRVVHAARSTSVCAADVYAIEEGRQTLCATLLATARNIELSPATRQGGL